MPAWVARLMSRPWRGYRLQRVVAIYSALVTQQQITNLTIPWAPVLLSFIPIQQSAPFEGESVAEGPKQLDAIRLSGARNARRLPGEKALHQKPGSRTRWVALPLRNFLWWALVVPAVAVVRRR